MQPSLTAPYAGTYKDLQCHANGYQIKIPGRDSDVINPSQLKPAFISTDEEANDEDQLKVTPKQLRKEFLKGQLNLIDTIFFFRLRGKRNGDAIFRLFETKNRYNTLLSISSVTSKTFIASKIYILGNSGRICQKAYNLPFVHAKFQRTGSSRLAST